MDTPFSGGQLTGTSAIPGFHHKAWRAEIPRTACRVLHGQTAQVPNLVSGRGERFRLLKSEPERLIRDMVRYVPAIIQMRHKLPCIRQTDPVA